MQLIFALIQEMAIFLVIAYLFSKSPFFRTLTGDTLSARHKFFLYVFFSALSILGTYLGLPLRDAIANTRAIGAVLAGLVGGPLLGGAVGLTAGLHRWSLGGFTAFSCGISTTLEGLLGGVVHLYLVRRGKAENVFNPSVALFTTFYAEMLQMAIILLLARPFGEAWDLVKVIALPMMLANSAGAALFVSILRDQRHMADKFGALFSARAFKIAERSLGLLRRGLTRDNAAEIAGIIHRETGVGAVAVTDREQILAFVGLGADHHRPGATITSALTQQAIREQEVIFVDGLHRPFECSVSANCPLGSALVVPLRLGSEVIGTIKLYEPKNRLFLKMNKALGEGIASLLSHQMVQSRYEDQKNLLVTSELKLLQAQINPHFLFNTLNTIVAVLRKDNERARELLLHLSNFFRKNLKRSGDLATLEEELDHVGSYLKIEKARFEERLQVIIDIDPALLAIKIPTFTLQPIIENAVKHGISQMLEPGTIKLSARREGDGLSIDIEDNAGTYCDKIKEDGLGIKIVDQRIRNLCGAEFGLAASCETNQWTRIRIRLPREGCRP